MAARHAGYLELRGAARIFHLEFDLFFFKFAGTKLFAASLTQHRRRSRQGVENTGFGPVFGLSFDITVFFRPQLGDGDLQQIAHDLFDIAADITDLGEFGGFHFDERGLRQSGQAARDFGLADAGGPDHQNVLGQHLFAQLRRKLLAPPAIAQGDGNGALGVMLADDIAVELGDDFAGGEGGGHRSGRLSMTTFSLV